MVSTVVLMIFIYFTLKIMNLSRKIFYSQVKPQKKELLSYMIQCSFLAAILFIYATLTFGTYMYIVFILSFALRANAIYKVYHMYKELDDNQV